MKPIGIIGGGLGGLSAACVLAARGHKVILFERNEWLGGKAAQLRGDGFRFDMGPTIVTIPSVLRRIFSEAGARLEDYLELVRLDPQWRCFFDDGSVARSRAESRTQWRRRSIAFAPGTNSGARYRDFIDYSERLERHLASATFSTNRSAACATCSSGRRRSIRRCSATCSRCGWVARSRARCAHSRPIRASRR